VGHSDWANPGWRVIGSACPSTLGQSASATQVRGTGWLI